MAVATARRHNEEILYLGGNPKGYSKFISITSSLIGKAAQAAISSSLLVLNKICKYRVGNYYWDRFKITSK